MNSESKISSEYLESSDKGTMAPTQRSQMKEFLRKPVDEKQIKEYGTSKPQRKIIRAKLIHDKD